MFLITQKAGFKNLITDSLKKLILGKQKHQQKKQSENPSEASTTKQGPT